MLEQAAMMIIDSALQGFLQLRAFATQRSASQIGQSRGIGCSLDQRVQHRTSTDSQHITGDGG
jgi:hypothetical protein